jgi:hypothetical protein
METTNIYEDCTFLHKNGIFSLGTDNEGKAEACKQYGAPKVCNKLHGTETSLDS